MDTVTDTSTTSEPASPEGEASKLGGSLLSGLAWTGAAKWSGQVLSWVSTLLVARILMPEDYGLVQMAMIYIGIGKLVNEMGIGYSVVTLRSLSRLQIGQLNGLALGFGLVSFASSTALAYPISWFFHAPKLPPVIMVLSVTFVMAALRTVPAALLEKALRFKLLALIDGIQVAVLALSALGFALLGWGYWALVLSHVVAGLVWTGATLAAAGHRLSRPRFSELREAIGFSSHTLASRLAWYVYSNADFVIAGRVLGEAALGAYTLAWTIAGTAVEKITTLVIRVTPAFFARIQNDSAALRSYLLRITEGLAIITFPASWGIALVVREFVLVLLGEKWTPAIAPLQLLAFYACFRSIAPLLSPILRVRGESRFNTICGVISAVILPVAFLVGSRWGTVGIATAWIVFHPLVTLPLFWRVCRKIDLPPMAYLRALWPALSSSILMAAAVLGMKRAMIGQTSMAMLLLAEVAVGAVVYCAVVGLLHRNRFRVFIEFVRQARAEGKA